MRFFVCQARKPIRSPSNAREKRAATKWRATGVSSPPLWRVSREPGHLCSTPYSDEHEECPSLPRSEKARGDLDRALRQTPFGVRVPLPAGPLLAYPIFVTREAGDGVLSRCLSACRAY